MPVPVAGYVVGYVDVMPLQVLAVVVVYSQLRNFSRFTVTIPHLITVDTFVNVPDASLQRCCYVGRWLIYGCYVTVGIWLPVYPVSHA